MGLVLAMRRGSLARHRKHDQLGQKHTEGIESPQAFREALLLPESALIQAMVCETVHVELSCSSVHQSKNCIRLRLGLPSSAKNWKKMTAIASAGARCRARLQPYETWSPPGFITRIRALCPRKVVCFYSFIWNMVKNIFRGSI